VAADPSASIKSLFAEFGVRMFAVGLDFFLISCLAAAVNDHVLDPIGLGTVHAFPMVFPLMLLFFALCWSSPLRATPAQFLLGMRVVDEAGETLSPGRALVRSLVLVALFAAAMSLARAPENPVFAVLSLAALVLVYLAIVTPNRQAAHDFLVRSIVVNRKALAKADRHKQLLQHVSDSDPATRKQRRPSLLRIVIDTLVLGLPAFAILITAQAQYDMDLRHRTSYALSVVEGLKIAVAEYHGAYARWPSKESDLGHITRGDYPDGGYFELEDNGAIRIRFTVKPELMKGSIVLIPSLNDQRISWTCRPEGSIARSHLPASCRD
jgi:uncharacterized RDD family membrane protein YckC